MDWNTFLGHERQRRWFQNAIAHNRLASTFLLVGLDGIGKRTFARLIAKTVLCTGNSPDNFAPCCHCESCAQIDASTHPDLIEIARKPEKTGLTMDQLVGEGEMRMREGLCYEIRMKPYSGKRKIAIVDDADTIATEGANAILKTLEEPPPGSLIFLISTSVQRQLPTIRSRCQMVRFQPLPIDIVQNLVMRLGMASEEDEALRLAQQSRGSLSAISPWSDETLLEFRTDLIGQIQKRPLEFSKLSKAIMSNLDQLGSDGQLKRERLKLLIDFSTQHYQNALRDRVNQSGATINGQPQSQSHTITGDTAICIEAIKRCLEAREHVDRMVTPAAIVESWLSDLAAIVRA